MASRFVFELPNNEASLIPITSCLLVKASDPEALKDAKGKPLDPSKVYKVATVEYLYFGGDGFTFENIDSNPGETGMSWQTPVIDWTKQQATSATKPLETLVK